MDAGWAVGFLTTLSALPQERGSVLTVVWYLVQIQWMVYYYYSGKQFHFILSKIHQTKRIFFCEVSYCKNTQNIKTLYYDYQYYKVSKMFLLCQFRMQTITLFLDTVFIHFNVAMDCIIPFYSVINVTKEY